MRAAPSRLRVNATPGAASAAAVHVLPTAPAQRHKRLQHSVSALALVCALGLAAAPGAVQAQTVIAVGQSVAGANGGDGGAGAAAGNGVVAGGTGGNGGVPLSAGADANAGGAGSYAVTGGAGSGAGSSGGGGGYAAGSSGGSSSNGGGAGAYFGGGGGGGVNGAGGGGGAGSGGGGGGGGGGLGNGGNGGGGGGGYGGYTAGYGGGSGGGGGGGGGGAVGFTASSNLTNNGTIIGGNGGNGGVGGFVFDGGGGGGAGAGVYAFGTYEITNNSSIIGGTGGNGAYGLKGAGGAGAGGAGLAGTGFTLNNTGSIAGGAGGTGGGGTGTAGYQGAQEGGGGGAAGDGIAANNFSVTNSGSVTGGAGGIGGSGTFASTAFAVDGGSAGAGGVGIAGTNFTLTNTGTVAGGAGGIGGDGSYGGGAGGAGGDGVSGSNFTVTNNGGITGGTGGTGGTGASSNGAFGTGGVGVNSTGSSSVTTAGSIAGGVGGDGAQADAVDFSGGGNLLELENGYSFTGNVISTSGTTNGGDTLALGGSTDSTFNLASLVATNPASYSGTPVYYGFNAYAKTGTGTWTLTGTSGAVTPWTVDDGTLVVADSAVVNGDVTVDNGATLRGTGTIGGNLTNSGLVEPGTTGFGTLSVSGNYVQTSDGTFEVTIDPDGSTDLLAVGGSASLAGTLAMNLNSGTYTVGTDYTILTAADGVSGGFSSVAYDPGFAAYLTPKLVYNADSVEIELTPTPVTTGTGQTTGNLTNDLAFSSGRIYVASNFAQDSALQNALNAPLGGLTWDDEVDRGYWLHGIGSFGSANGYNIDQKGFVIGKGFQVTPALVLGGAISNIYTGTASDNSHVDGNSFGAEIYGIYNFNQLTVSASAGVGHMGATLYRGLPPLSEIAKASSNGMYEGAALHAQYAVLDTGRIFIAPYVSVSYLHTGLGSAQETGAGLLDLRYDAMSTSLAQLGAGVAGGYSLPVAYGELTAWGSLGGTGTLGNPHVSTTETLGTYRAGESALAAPVGAFTPAAGVSLSGNGPWKVGASWDGSYGSATSAETFSVQARYIW